MADTQLPKKRVYRKWTEDDLRAEALKYSHRSEFKLANRPAYAAALRKGIVNQICEHMDYKQKQWTFEECIEVAKRYKNKRAFEISDRNAYQAARHNGWLDEISSHMEPLHKTWSGEDLLSEALKYKSRAEFARGYQSAYQRARERGILEDVCKHMGRPAHRTSDYDTIYMWRPKNCAYVTVGVTSSDLGTSRIETVARKMGVEPEIIIMSTLYIPATIIEAQIKKLGIPVRFSTPHDGYTEFRWMGEKDLSTAVQLITQTNWLN